jgi:iron complex transport system ATP-binding protein
MVVMLSVREAKFWYKADRPVLDGVSLNLEAGEIVCLLGPNGTGKTTLVRCVLDLQRLRSGIIELDGRPLRSIPAAKRAKMMAYVPQATTVAFPYTAFEIVLMGRVSHIGIGSRVNAADRRQAWESMERLGTAELADMAFDELSGGEKQMTLVARALAQQAQILVMDEPTANLDYHNQVRMLQVIRTLAREGLAVLMVSHFPDHAFLACTRALLMRDGRVMAQGPPGDIVTTENLSRLYSTPVAVTEAVIDGQRTKVCVPIMDQPPNR